MTALLAAAIAVFLTVPAFAADCDARWSGRTVPGTLTTPAQPCTPAEKPAPAPKARDERPGTFTSGNTTIHFGGSISTEFGFGGGRRR